MSLFYPALAGASLWALAGYSKELKSAAERKQQGETVVEAPHFRPKTRGNYTHVGVYAGADRYKRFVHVAEDIDQLGAKIYLVDYGNGSKTIQYHDPRELL